MGKGGDHHPIMGGGDQFVSLEVSEVQWRGCSLAHHGVRARMKLAHFKKYRVYAFEQ